MCELLSNQLSRPIIKVPKVQVNLGQICNYLSFIQLHWTGHGKLLKLKSPPIRYTYALNYNINIKIETGSIVDNSQVKCQVNKHHQIGRSTKLLYVHFNNK